MFSARATFRKYFFHPARWLLAACALLYGIAAHGAGSSRVALIVDQEHPIHEELIENLRRELDQFPGAPALSVTSLARVPATGLFPPSPKPPDLIVTVGIAATAQVSELGLTTPVLSVLVPKASFEEIARQRNKSRTAPNLGTLSAIYVDQPLARRLDLVKLIMPRARRIGVVLGPGNENFEQELSATGQQRRLQVEIRKIAEQDNLVTALDQVLEKSDVLLGVVDPLVFNRASAQNVLLTAYRHRVPLIGVSSAYVKAGALAAVYSTPSQIGRQLAETLVAMAGNAEWKPPAPQYPKYFSVAVNYQVTQSLGLVVDDEESLENKLAMPK